MRIGVIGSMQHTEKMIDLRDRLIQLGHDAYVTSLATPFIGKSDDEKESIKIEQKHNQDAIREFWQLMQTGDAVLVANYDKNGIKNYIGGNTFLEIGFAHVLNQKVFLLNPIPEIMYYQSELEAIKPTILYGELSSIEPSIGFAHELVSLVKEGSKRLTYRLGDKYDFLKVGDTIATHDSTTRKRFAQLRITEKTNTTFKDLPISREGHETYSSKEEMLTTFQKHYKRAISNDEQCIILGFELVVP